MPEAIPIVLWSWVPISLVLFWKLPPTRAAGIALVGGWLFLPTARFADDMAAVNFPYWIMPACLPSDVWTTKARVIGLALLLGIMAFDSKVWLRFRPSFFDLPMLIWCLVPLASGLVNKVSPVGALADSAYLTLSWGLPYLVGRLYFGDPAGLGVLARILIGGGLLYVPFCLIEVVTGPICYQALYGFHPFQHDGATRYLGFRPIVFLEHGNQLGTWMASSALTAAWCWQSGQLSTFWMMPGSLVVSLLGTTSILTQSAGAVILLFLGLIALELIRRVDRRWPILVVMALPLVFAGVTATRIINIKSLAMSIGLGRRLAELSTILDRQSLGWRIQVEERSSKLALQRPVLGWSKWDWWRESEHAERPWGLPGLVLGMYGVVGWLTLGSVLVLPIAAFLNLGPPRFWISTSRASATALFGSLILNDIDQILNSNLLLPYLAVAGGLIGLKEHAASASAWIRRAQANLKPAG